MNYKNYYLRQLGILKPKVIKEDHLKMVNEPDAENPSPLLKKLVSPVIAMAVRGTCSGGLPAHGVVKDPERARLGGFEAVNNNKPNSQGKVAETPVNPTINNAEPFDKSETPVQETPHPHQFQHHSGEPPQAVTGGKTNPSGGDTSNQSCPDDIKPKDISLNIKEFDKPGDKAFKDAESNLKKMDGNSLEDIITAYVGASHREDTPEEIAKAIVSTLKNRKLGLAEYGDVLSRIKNRWSEHLGY